MRRLSRMPRLSGMPGLPMWRRLRRMCGLRRCRVRRCRMRGLLRIVGPLPLVLDLGAFRMACPQADISVAGPEKGSGQLLGFTTALAPAI
jgi:hypothetical protein